jgi:hypothetical protein
VTPGVDGADKPADLVDVEGRHLPLIDSVIVRMISSRATHGLLDANAYGSALGSRYDRSSADKRPSA